MAFKLQTIIGSLQCLGLIKLGYFMGDDISSGLLSMGLCFDFEEFESPNRSPF